MLGTVRGPTPRWKKDKDVPDFMNDPQKAFMYATNCSAWSFSYCTASSCADYKGVAIVQRPILWMVPINW